MAEARKRPELTGVMTTALFGVPQVGVDVDKAKVLTQQVNLSNVYQTLQAFMGGALVNYYNQFGLQWQVWVQADGKFRTNVDNLGKFYVRNAAGEMVPLSTLTSTNSRSGTEFVMRQNLYQCVQINGSAAPGYSSGQAMAALGRRLQENHADPDGLRLERHELSAAEGCPGREPHDHLQPVVPGGLSHHGGAV